MQLGTLGGARGDGADVQEAARAATDGAGDGIGKRRLTGALRDHVPELPAPELRSVGGIVARGWRGRLLDQTPPEHQPFYDDRYKLLDGVEVPAGPSRQPRRTGAVTGGADTGSCRAVPTRAT